ncbi:MAG: hypothetical protein ACFB0C_06145 [Leptolyngbyaceae cyanobacterium]
MVFGHSLRRFGRQTLIGLLLVFALSLTSAAQANSGPPETLTWFDFEAMPGPIEAAQILACDTEACDSAYAQFDTGTCTVSGCLAPPQDSFKTFTCRDQTCLIVGGLYIPTESDRTAWFRLQVQSQGRLWASNVLEAPMVEVGSRDRFPVRWVDDALEIQPAESAYGNTAGMLFWLGLALTIALEASVVALMLRRQGLWSQLWRRTFVSFGLMHLVTYPMVWTLTNGFQPFSFVVDRVFAQIWLAIALIYGVFFYFLRQGRSRRLLLAPAVIFPLLFFPSLIVLFLFSYGRSTPLTTGLSYGMALAIAEVAVTVYEAIFLAMLSRGKLSLTTTGLLSLVMNGTSWAVGFWLFR